MNLIGSAFKQYQAFDGYVNKARNADLSLKAVKKEKSLAHQYKHEIYSKVQTENAKSSFLGRAAAVNDPILKVICVVAVVFSYIATLGFLFAVDQNKKISYKEAFDLVKVDHKVSLTLKGVAKSLAIRTASSALLLLGIRGMEKYAPTLYNDGSQYLEGVKEIEGYLQVPRVAVEKLQTSAYDHVMSGFQSFYLADAPKVFAKSVCFGLLGKLLIKAPVVTSVVGRVGLGFIGNSLNLGVSLLKGAYHEVQRNQSPSLQERQKVKSVMNKKNTLMGSALQAKTVAEKVFSVMGVLVLYAMTGFVLAFLDRAAFASEEDIIKEIYKQRSVERKVELITLGSKVVNTAVSTGMLYALGGAPLSSVSALFAKGRRFQTSIQILATGLVA